MDERKLATIRIVSELTPIDGADMIELAIVDGWQCVVKKGEFSVGDKVIYCEIDSFLPVKEEFEFLRKSSYKKLVDGTEGFRLKTIKLRGQVSQGLLLPLNGVLPDEMCNNPEVKDGDDVTELLGIIKWDPPVPVCLSGIARGNFPSKLHKTDQERVQNIFNKLPKDRVYWYNEKIDGSSGTFAILDGEFHVCSRNMNLTDSEGNTFWNIARQYDIENKLRTYLETSGKTNIAIQGEVYGEGIQKNKYKMVGHHLAVFDVFDPDTMEYFDRDHYYDFCYKNNLPIAPILLMDYVLPETVGEVLAHAEGKSMLNNKVEREGIVIKSVSRITDNKMASFGRISFKAISNKFLLKNDE